MTKRVMLIEKKENNREEIPFTIEKMDLIQLAKVLDLVSGIVLLSKEDEAINGMIQTMTGGAKPIDIVLDEDASDEERAEAALAIEAQEQERDAEFKENMFSAMITLLKVVPDTLYELLSTASGIKRDLLVKQDVDTALDVYDALLEVNDLQKIIDRAKKSLAATKGATAFLRKVRESTAPTQKILN